MDAGAGKQGGEAGLPGGMPPHTGTLVRRRRRHDRSKYPWRYQRMRRKLIQMTIVSSLALLFLCGVLYMMIASSRATNSDGSSDGSSSLIHPPFQLSSASAKGYDAASRLMWRADWMGAGEDESVESHLV